MSKVSYNQTGYVGCSISKRAIEAYDNGEMPKSKWTKKAILSGIAEVLWYNDIEAEKISLFEKMKKDDLFNMFVSWSSWHHTGKFANKTDFYEVSEFDVMDYLEDIGEAA